jgi:ATP-binding cassette subfamily B protein/ATP-binding cassette subfamily C protein/ATP-binding cassette subfamily B multidrug efflux pump
VLALFERGRAAWSRIDPVLRAPPAVADHGPLVTAPAGTLRFDAVTFAYPVATGAGADISPPNALADVTFALEPGATLGVVGPTGAGKSTLLALLLRHYAPQRGAIHWGPAALDAYALPALRGALAWVPQEPFLFSGTIAENIALANPDANAADIEEVARQADLDQDIRRLPDGYATLVGERGITLSGGQRQRVAIARALLTRASVLLLDDALSAVDTGTEARILGHLRNAWRGRGAIIVSHRLSALAEASAIIVLQAGRVTERGSHAELLARNGWYAAQWRYQQLEATLEAAP